MSVADYSEFIRGDDRTHVASFLALDDSATVEKGLDQNVVHRNREASARESGISSLTLRVTMIRR